MDFDQPEKGRVPKLEGAQAAGHIDTDDLCRRAASLFAHVAQADTLRLRRRVAAASIVEG